MTEDERVGWHHRLSGHEFDEALGVGDGQGSLACCSPWSYKESDTTEQLNRTEAKKDSVSVINIQTTNRTICVSNNQNIYKAKTTGDAGRI